MTQRQPKQTDPFDVWGWPPHALLKGMTPKQIDALRRYITTVSNKSYRIAYDCGLVEGLTKLSLTASIEMKRQRDKMLRSR